MAAKNRRKRRRSSARRSGDRRQLVPVLAAVFLIVVILIVMLINYLVKKYSPSDERMDLSAYFNLEQGDEAAIILEDDLTEFRARILDGEAYVTTDFLYEQLNQRFYWDAKENLLLYTTPTEVITASVGSNDYTVAKAKYTESYAPVKVDGDTAYVALKYIQKYTAMEFEVMTDEINRVHIQRSFGAFDTVSVKKDARVRFEPNIKSPILTDAVKGDILYVLPPDAEAETELPEDWTRVRTGNGFVGYIRNKYLGEKGQETKEPNYADPEYPSIQKDYTINMAWHQVTNADANNSVLEAIAKTKGLTTISPTWFFLNDNEGNIQSLASQTYVNYCHQNGIEVWALVNDIEYKDTIKDYEILSRTSSRQRLVNNLIAKAIEFDLDGLNIDFEFINAESAKAYIQFIRELSIMCRLNGIVLSVDNYVPADHNLFYNRKEQGIVADYVIIMGYDEHYATSPEAGSVASIDWVRKGIENTLSEVPAEKVINAVPFYTRIWETKDGAIGSKAVGMDAAEEYVRAHNITVEWNEETCQNYGEYTEDGSLFQVWLEDESSIEVKLNIMDKYQIAGLASWRLGFEKPVVWDKIEEYMNR